MHHLRKIYGFKGSSADKASIDLRHTHKLMSILWVHAAAILNAHLLGNFLPAEAIAEVSATGSLLIIGLGFNMLGFSKVRIRVGNMLPAILIPAVYLAARSLL